MADRILRKSRRRRAVSGRGGAETGSRKGGVRNRKWSGLVPVLVRGVDSHTHDLRGLHGAIGGGALVALVVAEAAVIEGAPAASELWGQGGQRGEWAAAWQAAGGQGRQGAGLLGVLPSLAFRSATARLTDAVLNRKPF